MCYLKLCFKLQVIYSVNCDVKNETNHTFINTITGKRARNNNILFPIIIIEMDFKKENRGKINTNKFV